MRGWSTFSVFGWAYGFTLTPLPTQMFHQICESWLKFYLMQVCKPCHSTLVETVEPFKLHPMSMSYIYEVFEHLLRLWMEIFCFAFTLITPQMLSQICESWLKSYLMQVCKPCHYALVEAVEPFKLHPTSMSYKYEVFEHLLRMWMGICFHTHTVTTTDASPDLGKLAEILPDAIMQTMPLYIGWGFRTFQTASHVHVIPIWNVCTPSEVVDGHIYGFTFTLLLPQTLPQIWESWLKSYLMQMCKPCHYALVEAVEPFQLHPMSMAYLYEVFEHLLSLWMGISLHTDAITTADVSPDLWELAELLPDASVQTMPPHFGWGCITILNKNKKNTWNLQYSTKCLQKNKIHYYGTTP